MAIEFKPFDNGSDTITIGGTITSGDNIITGPFPRYNVSKELIIKDTLYVGETYTITVTGTALISGSGVDMLTPGARQNALHDIMRDLLFVRGQRGKLIIEPYGGGANKIIFDDAKLTSVELPEQTDTSQGTQSQEYVFAFEASVLNKGSDKVAGPDTSGLKDVTESWEFGNVDEQSTQRNFTITHTLSATGTPVVDSGDPTDITSGYVAAKNFVNARLATLGASPFGENVKDFGKNDGQQKIFLTTGNNAPLALSDSGIYNQVNTYTQDILEGTFSVTRTWLASGNSASVTIEIVEGSDSPEYNTVQVSVDVQGYESAAPDSTTSTRYTNAVAAYNAISLSALAQAGYSGNFTLKGVARSSSVTRSTTAGTISATATFDDQASVVPGSVTSSVSVTDSNPDGGNQIVAIIPIIARKLGPIIQDMGTTNESTKSLSVEAQMPRNPSTGTFDKPTSFEWQNYAPVGGFRQNFSEVFSNSNGRYSLTVEWVYTIGEGGGGGDGDG